MSRFRLEEIITKFDLYPEAVATGTLYDAVERMRKHIEINLKTSGRRGDLTSFEVSFESKEPNNARNVTAALADLFIHYNFKLRQEQAAGTSRFLERELERMRDELRRKEELVGEFRKKYRGMLPEEMENNYRILSQLQQHLDSVDVTLQKTEDRKVLVRDQLRKLETLETDGEVPGDPDQELNNLSQLYQKLQRLKLRYSDRHPDIIRLEALIAKLEKEQNSTSPGSDADEYDLSSNFSTAQRLMHARKQDLSNELKMIDREIQTLRNEKENTREKIANYRQRIENGPKIEQMFMDLGRDYEMANNNYQSLLQKKLQAELAENLERTQKGEQFRILDTANMPQKPDKPDIPKILAVGLMLALGGGFGLAFLREYLDPTFWSRKEVERALELPVLVSIPVITTDKERRWKKIKLAATVCILLAMSSTLVFAMYVLWKKSPGFLPIPL
jgi:polysaccharide chain length determinant protein (PEP-CTERM system associated)